MKELSDEYIQDLLEKGTPIISAPDVRLYETVFKELNTHPELNIYGLSADVTQVLQYKLEWRSRIKSWIIAATVLIIGSTAFILAAGTVDVSLSKQMVMFLYHYKWIGLFIMMLIIASEVIDRIKLDALIYHQRNNN